MGAERIRRSLALKDADAVNYCKHRIMNADKITRQGKNWYVYAGGEIITVNSNSFTIITARKGGRK